jgi:hypothetical protein
MNHLQVLHNKVAKIILDAHTLSSASESLQLLKWQLLTIRRHFTIVYHAQVFKQ